MIQNDRFNRREFLSITGKSLSVIALNSIGLVHAFTSGEAPEAQGELLADAPPRIVATVPVRLAVTEALLELVDGRRVYMWAYQDPVAGPRIPGPIISATEGDMVEVTVTNLLDEPHSFSIPGIVDSGPIAPGQTQVVSFVAPAGGSYLYFDSLNAPVNRVLGLHGAFIVSPRTGNTPYSNPTENVQMLFDDLGSLPAFPGDPWDPRRSIVWIFNSIDTRWNRFAQRGTPIDPLQFVQGNLPDYFTINGKSGIFAAEDPATAPRGRIGQPALIRSMNAGLPTHSPHIHGNHVYELTDDRTVRENVILLDTWSMPPLKRKDLLLPFRQPPDIPPAAFPPRQERFPLVYPMHCHVEISQTSNGGNYPQGLLTHWMIEGPLT